MQIAVAGCLAQKDRDLIQTRAPHVDVVFGTHNVGEVATLLDAAAGAGPVMQILERGGGELLPLGAARCGGRSATPPG